VHAPGVDLAVQLVERAPPGVDVEVVGVDERAVDVEQDRGGDGGLLGFLRAAGGYRRQRVPDARRTYT